MFTMSTKRMIAKEILGAFWCIVSLRERLLWSTLHWPCTKSECKKVPLYPKLTQVPLCQSPPPSKMKIWKLQVKLDFRIPSATLPHPLEMEIWKFQVNLAFRIPSATLPPPSPEMKIWKVSSQLGLQNSKCHFTPPPPHPQKWKFGSFKSSWTSPPPPPGWKCKVGIFSQICRGTLHYLQEIGKCITCHLVYCCDCLIRFMYRMWRWTSITHKS